MARKSNKRKSANKQNRVLKKYSKGGFTKKEQKTIASKLGIKTKQAKQLTRVYSKQAKLKSAAKPKQSKVNQAKPKSNKSLFKTKGKSAFSSSVPGGLNKNNKGALKVKSTKTAKGVSKPKVTTNNKLKVKTTTKPKVTTNNKPKVKTATKPKVTTPKPKGPSKPNIYKPTINTGRNLPQAVAPPTPTLTVNPRLTTPPPANDNNQRIDDAVDSVDTTNQQYQARIDDLTNQISAQNTLAAENMNQFQNMYNESSAAYRDQIGGLQDRIGSYESQIGGYQSSIDNLRRQLDERAQAAKQFKLMDTQHLSNNSATGIRFRRSKKFRTGQFALGTAGLNRKNRSPLKISNVNL